MAKPLYEVANSKAQIREMLERKVEAVEDGIADALSLVGEESVAIARVKAKALPKDFRDQTGNLRSSYGYAVVRDKETAGDGMVSPTVTTKKGSDGGATGQRAGRAYLDKLKRKAPRRGLMLVVVAGMRYAKYVQAKGYDVLNSAELKMQEGVSDIVKSLRGKKK